MSKGFTRTGRKLSQGVLGVYRSFFPGDLEVTVGVSPSSEVRCQFDLDFSQN